MQMVTMIMTETANHKIKNALTRLAYLLSQTTRNELAETAVDVLKFYGIDNKKFLIESLNILEQICSHKNIIPRETYLLALAACEQVKHELK